MRKNRKKTLFVFVVIFLLFSGLFFFKKRERPISERPPIVTWERFSEINRLAMLLKGFGIESILEVPSFGHSPFPMKELPVRRYLGIVLDEEKALAMQVQFGSKERSFYGYDVRSDPLPKVDLILCWDYLSHLSPQEIKGALLQFQKSGARFLLIRQFPQVEINQREEGGLYHEINWERAPYFFPEPIIQIIEIDNGSRCSLALWNLREIALTFSQDIK